MDEYYLEDELELDDELDDDIVALGDAFREVLHEEYSCLSPEDTDEALIEVFESLTPAESFSLAKALDGLGKGSQAAVKNPTFQQLAGTALPVVGTAFGGPVGGTIAGAAGQALIGRPAVAAPPPAAVSATPAKAATADQLAKQALVAAYLPAVQKAVLANAIGANANQQVGGVAVQDIVNMLGTLLKGSVGEAEDVGLEHQTLYEMLVDLEDADLCDEGLA